jgi:hypothetical protein
MDIPQTSTYPFNEMKKKARNTRIYAENKYHERTASRKWPVGVCALLLCENLRLVDGEALGAVGMGNREVTALWMAELHEDIGRGVLSLSGSRILYELPRVNQEGKGFKIALFRASGGAKRVEEGRDHLGGSRMRDIHQVSQDR